MLDWFKLKKLTGASRSTSVPGYHEDSLDVFGSEHRGTLRTRLVGTGYERFTSRRGLVLAAIVVALVVVAITGYRLRNWRPFQVEAASASVTIESVPAGAEVMSQGVWKGRTTLTLALTPGEHSFELMYEGQRKPLRAVARAGAAVVHHVELHSPAPAAPVKGASLRVTTQPPNQRVLVDGVARGTSPLTIDAIAPGKHKVQAGSIERTVEVAAGESAAVIITAPGSPAGPAAGWLTVTSPVTLQIREDDEVIGTSAASKVMLPAGRHDLVLVNDAIGFSEKRTVQVSAGDRTLVKVELPNVPLSINALPWAEVWLDGKPLGETPIGNLQVRPGPHDIVFRHPELGERRQTVTVTLNRPARVSLDMRKPGS